MSDAINLDRVENAIRDVHGAIRNIEYEVSSVKGQVGELGTSVALTHNELLELKSAFKDFVEDAAKTANVQRAETKLGTIKDELDRQFGHYRVVRRTSVGILQAFDVGNVSNSTVTQVTEELMIQTPNYWLAPAIVALAAWSKDDQHIAELSVQEAFNRDPRKTSLFFALVLRRTGRRDAASRWLRHYLMGLDPAAIGREFAVIYEAAARGTFGRDGNRAIAERLGDWNRTLRNYASATQQSDMWEQFIRTRGEALNQDEFPLLRRFSPDYDHLRWLLESADSLGETAEDLAEAWVPAGETTAIADQLDDILELLVTEFDEEELPLRREVALNEAIIEEEGDLDRARDSAQLTQDALQVTTDALSMQTFIAMEPKSLGVGPKTRQLAIGISREDILNGISQFTLNYRSQITPSLTITLKPDHTALASTFGFPGWTTNTGIPEVQGIASLQETWNRTFHSFLEQNRMNWNGVVVAGVITLVAAVIGFFFTPMVGTLFMAIGLGTTGYLWYSADKASTEAIARLVELRGKAVHESTLIYRGCLAEYFDASQLYHKLDSEEQVLIHMVENWPVGQVQPARG